jgi:hypothetical protein
MKGRRHTHPHAAREIGRTAVLAGLIAGLLASGVAMAAAVRTIDLGPKVGDILIFRQGAHMPPDWEFTVTNTAAEQTASCLLQPGIMAAGGGSLVVEERFQSPRLFRVHWAGTRTSQGSANCGPSAELEVSGVDLQLLSNAVGGPGVGPKSLDWF